MKTVTLAELFPDHVSGYWGKEEGARDVDAWVIRNSDVLASGAVRWTEVPRRSFSTKELAKAQVRAGDLLLTTSGDCGRVALVNDADEPTIASNFVRLLRPDPCRSDPRFLWHQMRTGRFRAALQPFIRGTTIDNLSVGPSFGSVQLVLPPMEEQRRIAEVLDAADELRAKRREALAKLDTLTQAIFINMFGDPIANPRGVPTARLDEVFDIARGGSPRPIQDFLTDDPSGVNWVMIGDAPEGTKYITGTSKRIRPEGEKRSRRVYPGDLLLTNSMSFGRPYVMRTTGCIHDGWLVLSPKSDRTSSDFFHAALGMRSVYNEFVRRAPGATVKNLNIDLVRSLALPVPSAQDQARFATMVGRSEACVPRAEDSMALLDDLFASLQQRAFRGEL